MIVELFDKLFHLKLWLCFESRKPLSIVSIPCFQWYKRSQLHRHNLKIPESLSQNFKVSSSLTKNIIMENNFGPSYSFVPIIVENELINARCKSLHWNVKPKYVKVKICFILTRKSINPAIINKCRFHIRYVALNEPFSSCIDSRIEILYNRRSDAVLTIYEYRETDEE